MSHRHVICLLAAALPFATPLFATHLARAEPTTPVATVVQITTTLPLVVQITRDGRSVTSARDVTLQSLDDQVTRGIQVGQRLNDVRVAVPSGELVVIASPNHHDTVTLEPGATIFLHYTGALDAVSVIMGKVVVDDEDNPGFFGTISEPGGVVQRLPSVTPTPYI